MIKTRTVVQTTAHAQNYFQQLMKDVNEYPVIARTSQPPVIARTGPFNVIARASPPNVIARTSQWIEDTNENSGRWNKTEHDAFLSGLELYGKNWRQVAAHVKTRTVIQTRTHAQKYFAMKKTSKKKPVK
jgi:SHAQKYF class myb-like DNA-binding protein